MKRCELRAELAHCMPVAGLVVALGADKHRAQARFGEEGLGREVRPARGVSPRVQRGFPVSPCEETGLLGPLVSEHFPGSFTTLSCNVIPQPANSCSPVMAHLERGSAKCARP